jgi:hypothetical protein
MNPICHRNTVLGVITFNVKKKRRDKMQREREDEVVRRKGEAGTEESRKIWRIIR